MTGVYVRTLGCKVNRVESESLLSELDTQGYPETKEEDASLIVINSCAVTAEAEHKVRKEVRRALKANPTATVLIAGCATVFSGDELRALDESRVITEPDKTKLAKRALEVLRTATGNLEVTFDAEGCGHGEPPSLEHGSRTRKPLKIQDGCDNFCTYCLISRVRGPLWSESLEGLVARAKAAYESGTNEVVLTGINLARFHDPETGEDLADLVNAITALEGPRVRLSSIEPPDLTPKLLTALSSSLVARHLHVPLQAGSDRILQAMGRKYSVAEYREWIEAARRAMPGLSITADVIVGFPGETEADFDETRALCEEIGFSKIHVFKFSAREHTPAHTMGEQIDPHVKAERSRLLRELSDVLRERFLEDCRKRSLDVIVEKVEDGKAMGTSSEYASVVFEVPEGVNIGQRLVLESSQIIEIR